MRFLQTVLFLTLLTACDTPTLEFSGVPPNRVVVDGSTFDVRVLGTTAQALRLNMELAPNGRKVFPKAKKAIEQVSGCAAETLSGDAALIHADLKC